LKKSTSFIPAAGGPSGFIDSGASVENGGFHALPYTFRPPSKGADPYFGLTRSWYYAAEVQGRITLIRLRAKGKSRGVTLVLSAEVKSVIDQERLLQTSDQGNASVASSDINSERRVS